MSDIMPEKENQKAIDKIFKIKDNDSSVKTEIIGGFTTFMAMAYIIALNPNILTNYKEGGQPLWNGVFLATCISSFIAMLVMAFLANKPFCLAPGMGLNSFMATVIANLMAMTKMSYVECFQAMLCIVLVEGIIFFILSIFNIRDKIVTAIPLGIRLGITPGIGLMLLNIGFGSNVYIANKDHQFFVMKDFFGSLTANFARDTMTDAYATMILSVLTMFLGLFIIVILAYKNVKASVIIGMLLSSVFYWIGDYLFLHNNPFASLKDASFLPAFGDMFNTTLFRFNFGGLVEMGWFTAITLVITFCIIDMFDTIGTLVGTASRAGMVDEEGNMPNMKEAFIADSVGTIVGSCTGTSTVTTFIESASGIAAGGRTGLTSLICGLCFFICIFLAPLAAIIPAAATSSALIYVGILMMSGLKKVDFDDFAVSVPVTIMLIAMPISGSIGHAIGLAMISFTIIKVFTGKFKEVPIVTYIISIIFVVKFFLIY
ncbi:permease [Anaeromyces robustus]|jgi:AGZA family xanthine/uracil permease-like MFS transporter|uniref:Permease n=1 Tax=Anaeromyces robustus TaxID=1754192 RepID=A0A1Y1VTR2_9FUNG|nr:permease [Anaeromyces robustus]|eukprot:ORX64124.1 permease [Anaeromyces robustus]